jgi:hypothetical protein
LSAGRSAASRPGSVDGEQQAGILERVETGGKWAQPDRDATSRGESPQPAVPATIAHGGGAQPEEGAIGQHEPVSVFRYYGNAIEDGIDPLAFLGVTAAAVALAWLFERSDLAA